LSESDDTPLDAVRPKLVETKQRWAAEGRLLTDKPVKPHRLPDQRLPPGQHLVQDWPVLDLGVQPDVPPERWRLQIDGLVDRPIALDWAAFKGQPRFHDVSDMHCVTSWSRYDNAWEGVGAKHLLALVQPKPEARFIVFHSYDGYTTNLPLAEFDRDDALLADSWQGEPLTRVHGGPVRAIVPQLYLWKSAKWINRIEFIAADRSGFWEVRGYHDHGDPWTEERYS